MFVILIGDSSAGKSTVKSKLLDNKKRYESVITSTTRKKRIGEVEGVDYHFLNKNDFIKEIENGEYIESEEINGNIYGTSKKSIEYSLKTKKAKVIILDEEGAKNLQSYLNKKKEKFVTVLLHLTEEEMRNRMKKRGDKEKDIEKRLKLKISEKALILHKNKKLNIDIIINGNLDLNNIVGEIENKMKNKKNKECLKQNKMK